MAKLGTDAIFEAKLMDRDTTDDVEQELGMDRVKVRSIRSPLTVVIKCRAILTHVRCLNLSVIHIYRMSASDERTIANRFFWCITQNTWREQDECLNNKSNLRADSSHAGLPAEPQWELG